MSLYFILIIMLFSGLIGGWINSMLSANINPGTGAQIQTTAHCILIGIGATILVPLFLEITQSKLLDKIHSNWSLQDTSICIAPKMVQVLPTKIIKDTLDIKAKKDSSKLSGSSTTTVGTTLANENDGLKIYLIFLGYSFLAAVAGPRFINNLLDSVIKDKQIDSLTIKNEQVTAEKDQVVAEKDKVVEEKSKIEEKQELQTKENRVLAEKDELFALRSASFEPSNKKTTARFIKPQIGPVTVKDDPQKGRFGGKSENNGRALKASVVPSNMPEFYNVTIWVESTEATKPLTSDVIFYLHDSFHPSVYTVKPGEFRDEKAIDDEILSYGAFTVGAVTDNGETLLELDLADGAGFPPDFRKR